MKHFAGLDVSLKEVSICVVDEDGKAVARGVAPADAAGVAGWLTNRSLKPDRIVHESGQLSIWLQRGMIDLGLLNWQKSGDVAGKRQPTWGMSAQTCPPEASVFNCTMRLQSASPFWTVIRA